MRKKKKKKKKMRKKEKFMSVRDGVPMWCSQSINSSSPHLVSLPLQHVSL